MHHKWATLLTLTLLTGCAATPPNTTAPTATKPFNPFGSFPSAPSNPAPSSFDRDILTRSLNNPIDVMELAKGLHHVFGVEAYGITYARLIGPAIVVCGKTEDLKLVSAYLDKIDTDNQPHLVTVFYPLKNARAKEMADFFENALAKGLLADELQKNEHAHVIADVRTNAVIIITDEKFIPAFKQLLEELDKPPEAATKPKGASEPRP